MVIPPAKTGKDRSNKIAVINTAQTNNGNLCIVIINLFTFVNKWTISSQFYIIFLKLWFTYSL